MAVPLGGNEHQNGLEQLRVVSQLGCEVRLGQLVLAGKLEAVFQLILEARPVELEVDSLAVQ